MSEPSTVTRSSCKGILKDPVHWLAFGFGSGCSPWAPGTFGTLAAIPVYLLLQGTSLWMYLLITTLMFFIGIWLCGKTTKKLGVHDHSGIVWDEIVGYLVTMIAAPQGWLWIVTGFVLFRVFDILKPWPISIADKKISGGFGIMIDDIIAGIFAFTTLQLILHFNLIS
ncbi:MAG: phosphatidylglycerophosphatase A [Gammaproteobacteria bacterium]|nr:phosphatidylglycerophosphatase A [Gammaproteobacteria bacterium]MDX2488698.1 phosphatidylglycerophosphatase A [Gammaproteobacteria bacterium]